MRIHESTYYILGESRNNNQDNAITKMYGGFYIAFEIFPATGEVVGAECAHTLELTNDFIRRLFLHKRLERDEELIVSEIKRRYHGSSANAVIAAYRHALQIYRRIRENER